MTPSRIEAYALLGDTRTAALSADGSIDWLCVPRFDARPVFGALVGGRDAGRYAIRPAAPWRDVRRAYRSATTTVETSWQPDGATATLTEGMVADVAGTSLPSLLLVRRVTTPEAGRDAGRRRPSLRLGPAPPAWFTMSSSCSQLDDGERRPSPAVGAVPGAHRSRRRPLVLLGGPAVGAPGA